MWIVVTCGLSQADTKLPEQTSPVDNVSEIPEVTTEQASTEKSEISRRKYRNYRATRLSNYDYDEYQRETHKKIILEGFSGRANRNQYFMPKFGDFDKSTKHALRVIGINPYKLHQVVKKTSRDIVVIVKDKSKREKGQLGVNISDTEDGVTITSIMEKGSAEESGLLREDIIHTLNDRLIYDVEELMMEIENKKAGTTLKLGVIREGQKVDVTLFLKPKIRYRYNQQYVKARIVEYGKVKR